MEISEKQIKRDYDEELKDKTLKFGNIISIGALPALGYSIFQDIYIVNLKELAIWRIIALIPALIFLVLSFFLFRKNNRYVIFFHCLTLIGIMIMMVGTNITVMPGDNDNYKMGIAGSSIVFIFIVFLFSFGARKYIIYIILIPLFILIGFLILFKNGTSIDWPYFSNYGFISIAVIIMAFMAEKMSYNGFKMRKIAEFQKEISRSVKIEAEKSRMRAKDAEMANEIKNNFLAIMSHELRTPLNGIIGFTDILLKTENDKDKIEKLKIIQNSSDILLKLVNDLLDITRIESGNIEVKNETFDLNNLLDNINKVFSIEALKKNNKFILNKDKNLPQYLIGDSLKLQQILSNIISNAVKFTENGIIKIDIEEKLKTKDPDKSVIVFKITDTGIGIKENKIDKVFDKFTQADNSTTRKYGGTGLGLSIVKELMQALKGKIEVESNPGHGSTFTIELNFLLPDKKIVNLIKQKKLRQNSIHDFSSFNVLIAEDNKFNQEVVKKMLEMKKCNVEVAATGFEVLDLLEKNQFDLVLMDIEMPELNGYDTTIKIRNSEKNYKDIPIIALTAYAMEKDKRECLKVGINEFIAKPIQIDSFYEIINKYKK